MKRLIVLACLTAVVFLGCQSTSPNDSFLLQKLDDQGKSRALTEAGVEEYDIHLVRQSEFERIADIRNYFVVALKYDANNARAQQYLNLVDDYKNAKLRASLKSASKGLQKQKRSDDENYAIFVSLQAAIRIDPGNAEAQKMLNDTASVRSALVTSYLAKAKAAAGKVDDKSTDTVREKQFTEAFQNTDKALDIEPKSFDAQNQKNAARAELAKLVTRRVDKAQKAIAAGSFGDARTQVGALSDLNRRVDNSFDTEVRQVTYTLNYKWALTLFNKKDYTTAEVKNEAALSALKTDEARALRRKIADQKTTQQPAATAVSFEASMQDIDGLIGAGELVAAHRKVNALAKVTKDPGNMQQLDDRNEKILASLKDIYDKGVQSYRDEDFKTAIDLLQTVVAIQVDYEQASDYLDKARSKQKLLDQY
ncbi:MAG TPA: hypothetical protein VMV03_06240 [Spirochaetia bacterium]|nr:hypothetical protein [Spirochaetia bacterium]